MEIYEMSQLKDNEHPEQKKIVFFVQDFAGGGAERVMVRMANALHAMGLAVEIAAIREEGPCRDQLHPDIKVTILHSRKTILSLPALICFIRRARPYVLCTTIPHVCILAVLACRLSGVPVRVVLREANVYPALSRRYFPLVEKIAYILTPYIYPLADGIIAVSDSIRAEMTERMPGLAPKIRVIHNPLDIPALQAEAEKPVDHPWFAPGSPPVILAVGRLHPQKDYPTLLEAFKQVCEKTDARLVILGTGPEKEKLVRMAEDLGINEYTDFAGFQTNVLAFMKHCAVYVLPSLWEGCPNTLMEALACAPRVVASDCQGASRVILDDGKIGKLVSPQDPSALADALMLSLAGPLQTDKLRLRAAMFDSKIIADQYKTVLLEDRR